MGSKAVGRWLWEAYGASGVARALCAAGPPLREEGSGEDVVGVREAEL